MSRAVTNHMGGTSFVPEPVQRLQLMMLSGIFGEPSYYVPSAKSQPTVPEWLSPYIILDEGGTVEERMEQAIDEALASDFDATVSLLKDMRQKYLMRKNPQILAIRACLHPARTAYTATHGRSLTRHLLEGIERPDDIAEQLKYLEHLRKGKLQVPGILKRVWAQKIEGFDKYRMMKYGPSLIDPIRLSHAKGPLVGELLKRGKVAASGETTWERLRSAGKSWSEILDILGRKFPHMALLRNLRGIACDSSVPDERLQEVLAQLASGVRGGKQFPFRYYSAYKEIDTCYDMEAGRKTLCKEGLERCIDIAATNMPSLSGHTVALCDNSGSAWGAAPSMHSSVHVAEVANLAGMLAVKASSSGTVVTFGERYKEHTLSGKLLKQLDTLCTEAQDEAEGVGMGDEGGLWQYLHHAIENKVHIDNLFIYSDMQAGTGELYGEDVPSEYQTPDTDCLYQYISLPVLITKYREAVNPKMNVFSIQVAGYDNSVMPTYLYRCALLAGWTGAEVTFASAMDKVWN